MQSQKSQKNIVKTLIQEIDEQFVIKEYKHNNIVKERVELYKDFIISLTCKIHKTYFGHEYLKTENDFDGHFKWCFNKVADNYKLEGFDFTGNSDLFRELRNYAYTTIYYLEDNEVEDLKCHIKCWEKIFTLNGSKKNNDLEYFLELYKMFNEHLEKK